MQVWSDEEVRILKDHFPKEGSRVSRRLPGKNRIDINKKTKELGLKWDEYRDYNPWTSDEEETLKTYYPIEGKAVSKRLPRHTIGSIMSKVQDNSLKYRDDYWTDDEDTVVKQYYNAEGKDITGRLPGRTWDAIKKRARSIGVRSGDWGAAARWTEDEDIILKRYYQTEGKRVVERLPGRSLPSIKNRAVKLNLTVKHLTWTEEEDRLLSMYYPIEKSRVSERFPNRTKTAVMLRARHLGLLSS